MDRPLRSKRAQVARLLGVGWFIAIFIAGGAIGGFFLDSMLGSAPALMIVGTLLGVAVSGVGTYRMVRAVLDGHAGTD